MAAHSSPSIQLRTVLGILLPFISIPLVCRRLNSGRREKINAQNLIFFHRFFFVPFVLFVVQSLCFRTLAEIATKR